MNKRFVALAIVLVALAACNNEKSRRLIDSRADETNKGIAEAKAPAAPASYNPLTVTDKVWAGGTSLRLRRGMPLPAKYEVGRGVTLIAGEPVPMQEIASMISTQTGIPVRLASGVEGGRAPAATGQAAPPSGMTVSYEGPLSGLLDQVAGYFGVNWRYDGAAINFSKFETRVFVVESLPGTQTIKDGVKEDENSSGNNSSSSSTAGGSYSASATNTLKQSAETNVELKVWDELKETVLSMLGGVGTVVIAPSSGTITVTTTPDIMRTVAKFIEEENKRLSRQIAINVEIYTVSLSEGTDFSITFNEALRRLSNAGANYLSPSGPTASQTVQTIGGTVTNITGASVSGGGSLSVAILDPKTTGQISGVFSALSTLGDTSRVAQFPLTTLNNRPVSRRVGQDRTYVASISNSTSQTFSNNSITPGTVRDGFSLQLTPRLLDDGRILLQYSLSLTDIIQMTSFDTGSGTIQLPRTSNRIFVQQSLLKSGSTLIIGGYDDEQASQSSQGVGNAYNYLLGGGSSNATSRAMLFIAISPQVLDVARAERE